MIEERTISNIISEDFVFARVLDFFGIKFYEYSSSTLTELCNEKQLSSQKLIEQFESYKTGYQYSHIKLEKYPVELIIEYLKHAHHVFVKDRLSYIARLINEYNLSTSLTDERFMQDLQFIFPLFVEEFVKHIYEEEDHFFAYLQCLVDYSGKKQSISKVYYMMEKNSVLDFSMQHGADEDEMKGIRVITNDYTCSNESDIHLQVILKELKRFDEDLKNHALIEDNILIPKGIRLEERVKSLIKQRAVLN